MKAERKIHRHSSYYASLPDIIQFRDEIDEVIGLITLGTKLDLEEAKHMLREISEIFSEYVLK